MPEQIQFYEKSRESDDQREQNPGNISQEGRPAWFAGPGNQCTVGNPGQERAADEDQPGQLVGDICREKQQAENDNHD